jgi:hypothetical protein
MYPDNFEISIKCDGLDVTLGGNDTTLHFINYMFSLSLNKLSLIYFNNLNLWIDKNPLKFN